MPVMNADAYEAAQAPTIAGRIADTARHAAHFSHEARLFRSMAADAVEDGVYAVTRALKTVRHGIGTLEDLKEEGTHYVKRQPFKAIGMAAGIGLVVGLAVGWISGGLGRRQS